MDYVNDQLFTEPTKQTKNIALPHVMFKKPNAKDYTCQTAGGRAYKFSKNNAQPVFILEDFQWFAHPHQNDRFYAFIKVGPMTNVSWPKLAKHTVETLEWARANGIPEE